LTSRIDLNIRNGLLSEKSELNSTDDLLHIFHAIISKGKKDNTYKFALARFLLEYSYSLENSILSYSIEKDIPVTIDLSEIAKAFLKYYWYQICKYKIRQNHNPEKLPLIVKIIQAIFGEQYIPEPFDSMPSEKISLAENEIHKKCFFEVIPRFQNLPYGVSVTSTTIFYTIGNDCIHLDPLSIRFFRENFLLLNKVNTLEWAKFLEKINLGLPMLISKLERQRPYRSSLEKHKTLLSKWLNRCFYCDNLLSSDKKMIHLDHLIPWSYIFEDELWNLVLTCRTCNLMKHDSLPEEKYIHKLIDRNNLFSGRISYLKKSLLKLDPGNNHGDSVLRHYQNCIDYGFSVIHL
jgi:hypothetical protein